VEQSAAQNAFYAAGGAYSVPLDPLAGLRVLLLWKKKVKLKGTEEKARRRGRL